VGVLVTLEGDDGWGSERIVVVVVPGGGDVTIEVVAVVVVVVEDVRVIVVAGPEKRGLGEYMRRYLRAEKETNW